MEVTLTKISDMEVLRAYISAMYSELFGENRVPAEAEFDDIFAQLADMQNSHWAYEVTIDDEAVGFVTLVESCSVFAQRRYGIINELWIDKAYRCGGIGSAVIKKVRKLGAQRGWKRIDVSTLPVNSGTEPLSFTSVADLRIAEGS